MTPLKSIRKHCLECSTGSPIEVKNCAIQNCPLFTFRFGKNPNRKGIGRLGGVVDRKHYSTHDFPQINECIKHS